MDESDERKYHWATPNSDGFNMWLDGEHVRAENKVLKLTQAQHDELQKLIRSGRPDIAQNVQYIDMEAAEKVARAHIASHRGVAGQGAHSTNTAMGGVNANALKDAPRVDVPNPNATGDGKTLSALQARLQAQQAHKIVPNPDEVKKLDVIEEGSFHPEDMTAEQITALEAAGKAPVT